MINISTAIACNAAFKKFRKYIESILSFFLSTTLKNKYCKLLVSFSERV